MYSTLIRSTYGTYLHGIYACVCVCVCEFFDGIVRTVYDGRTSALAGTIKASHSVCVCVCVCPRAHRSDSNVGGTMDAHLQVRRHFSQSTTLTPFRAQTHNAHSLNFPRVGTKLWRCLQTFITSVRMRFGSCSKLTAPVPAGGGAEVVGAQRRLTQGLTPPPRIHVHTSI